MQKLDETATERCMGRDRLGLLLTPWQMVALELKLAKKVTADKEGAGQSKKIVRVVGRHRGSHWRMCGLRSTAIAWNSESSEHVRKTTGFLHKQLENQNSLGERL